MLVLLCFFVRAEDCIRRQPRYLGLGYVDKRQGMVVIVRSDYATKAVLGETMRQLKYVNAKVLGFVFNGVKESAGNYYKKYYRKGYGYEYGYGGNEDDGK